jgi:ribosomal protein S14
MPVDRDLLATARGERDRLIELQHECELAQVGYQHAVRRLHASGASLREIADALGVSYQRVHQIVDLSTGKGALKQSRIHSACSFCGRDGAHARLVVAGPGIFICDGCVDLAAEVLRDGEARSSDRTSLVCVAAADGRARCGFCGRRRADAHAIAEAPTRPHAGKLRGRRPGVRICAACVELCQEIVAEELSEV